MGDSKHIAFDTEAERAFSTQAPVFDAIYSTDSGIRYKRQRVRSHVLPLLKPGARILELNSGTGEDALFFASLGFRVHATDISAGMQEQLQRKCNAHPHGRRVTCERCSFMELEKLADRGPYDHIFSNFAGLNCTGELDRVLDQLGGLLKPGGGITLVMLPRFCLWETMLVFRGRFRTAFRRWFSRNGRTANVEGVSFKCWYYPPSVVYRRLESLFEKRTLEGMCIAVPPSYIQGFEEKYPRCDRFLKKIEQVIRFSRAWRTIGDYYILSMTKKG